MASPCYVYAILRREARIPPELTGLEDAPLSMVSWRELAAAVSPIERAAIAPAPASLLRHELVVEALCQAGPALPVRFGAILAGQDAVIDALARQSTTLLADLERVGDKVELGLTILWGTEYEQEKAQSEPPQWTKPRSDGNTGPGARYLQDRLAHYQRETAQNSKVQALIANLERALRPSTLEQVYRRPATERIAARAAYLVHPHQINMFQQAVDELRQAQPDLRWLISGPWPPYSFVTGAGKLFQQPPGLKLDSREKEARIGKEGEGTWQI